MKQMGMESGEVVPPADATFDVAVSLSLDGLKIRHARDDHQWSGYERKYVPLPETNVFDGLIGKTFRPVASTYMYWPVAKVKADNPLGSSLYLTPLITLFRPFSAEMRLFDLETLDLIGRGSVLDGASCLELRRRQHTYEERVWVDPARDFVMVRFLTTTNGRPGTKIDVRYRGDSFGGWVPTGWDIASFHANGSITRSMHAILQSCEINVSIDPSDFEMEFPPGTRVVDDTDPTHEVNYIAQSGGKKRIIQPNEMQASYEQLLASRYGEAFGVSRSPVFSISVVGAMLVALLAGGWLLYRRWNARLIRN